MSIRDKKIKEIVYNYTYDPDDIEEENRVLKETVSKLKDALERMTRPPLMVCDVAEVYEDKAVIKVPNGNMFYVEISPELEKLSVGDAVLCDQKNLNIVRVINNTKKYNVEKFVILENPKTKWSQIGGLKKQTEEIKEVIELPLKKPELFKRIGITPPKGILLHGPPGTGKTLLAKAVASSTKSTFIELVGSELVQKFIGEGAKLVKEVFELAREKAPSIVFIDELDAIAATRIEIGTSGEREVQRTFMQFLAELDGFEPLDNVKVIGCTNRKDILDPAIIRPGRLDRLIYVPVPDFDGRKEIFNIHTKYMTLDSKINTKKILEQMDGFSGAEIKAVCTEAGYFAIRANRTKIFEKDLLKSIDKVKEEERLEGKDYLGMFG